MKKTMRTKVKIRKKGRKWQVDVWHQHQRTERGECLHLLLQPEDKKMLSYNAVACPSRWDPLYPFFTSLSFLLLMNLNFIYLFSFSCFWFDYDFDSCFADAQLFHLVASVNHLISYCFPAIPIMVFPKVCTLSLLSNFGFNIFFPIHRCLLSS